MNLPPLSIYHEAVTYGFRLRRRKHFLRDPQMTHGVEPNGDSYRSSSLIKVPKFRITLIDYFQSPRELALFLSGRLISRTSTGYAADKATNPDAAPLTSETIKVLIRNNGGAHLLR
jgi:hypothetical protein